MLSLVIGIFLLHLLIGILLAGVASNGTKNYLSPCNDLDHYPHDLTLRQKDWRENPMHSSLILVVHIGTGSIYSYGKNQYTNMYFLYVECRIIPPIKAIISLTMTCNKFRRIH